MMESLDMFQGLVDNGSICPNSLNMNTAEQLDNFNVWLAQLTDSLDNEQPQQQQQQQHIQQQHNIQQQQQSYDYAQSKNTNYTDMLLQFDSPVSNSNGLYPTNNVEEDLYVRSHPIQTQQQPNYNPSTPTKLYGDFNMPPMMDNLNQFGYPDVVPQMNGVRHHYANVPNIVTNNTYFTPSLHTTQNLGSSKDDVKYKKKSPTHSQETEEKAEEAFKPIKPTLHESKKNVTTMMNVFASVDGNHTKKPASPADETKQSPAKKSAVSKDILDLLVSDMSDLAIKKKPAEKEESSLYPTSIKASSSSSEAVERHRKLLKQLSQWVNQNYATKDSVKQEQHIKSSSVQVK